MYLSCPPSLFLLFFLLLLLEQLTTDSCTLRARILYCNWLLEFRVACHSRSCFTFCFFQPLLAGWTHLKAFGRHLQYLAIVSWLRMNFNNVFNAGLYHAPTTPTCSLFDSGQLFSVCPNDVPLGLASGLRKPCLGL